MKADQGGGVVDVVEASAQFDFVADFGVDSEISTEPGAVQAAVSAAQFLVDTSALARMLRPDGENFGWDRAAIAGLIAVCPLTELEFFYSARSAKDRTQGVEAVRALFGRAPIHDRAYDRASEVQDELTRRGQHRSAGAVDLVVAATAELSRLTLLHRDADFDCVAAVTGQPLQWFGPAKGA